MQRILSFFLVLFMSASYAPYGQGSSVTSTEPPVENKPLNSRYFEIDMARMNNGKTLDQFGTELTSCRPATLQIDYAFGQARLWTQTDAAECRLKVEVQGELNESDTAQSFDCNPEFFKRLNWMQDRSKKRQKPPLAELEQSSLCTKLP